MNKNVLAISAGAIAAIFSANAHAYEKAKIVNMAPWPAAVAVKYAGCKGDSFEVPAAAKGKAGVASAPVPRGGCLITSITGTFTGKTYPVTSYTSKGTSNYEFIIAYKPPYEIKCRQEVGEEAWATNLQNTRSPEGDYGR